ncbi:MAG: undecaprenyl-phosphate glucose phosphotransferase [Chloroflexi bacterium]|nr:undecaprenyl-phosphate glucose phosphotransferase [Chloroflexota bacterium]
MLIIRLNLLHLLFVLGLLAADVLSTRLAWAAAYALRVYNDPLAQEIVGPLSTYDNLLLLLVGTLVVVIGLSKLYIPRRGVSRVDLLYSLSAAISLGVVAGIATTAAIYRSLEPPRLMLAYWWALSIPFVWLGRCVVDGAMRLIRARGFDQARVLVVGAGEPGRIVYERIQGSPGLGYSVVGFVDDDPAAQPPGLEPLLGPTSMIVPLIHRYGIGEVIIANPALSHRQMLDLVAKCGREHVNVKVVPDVLQIMSSEVTTSELAGLPMIRVRDVSLRGWNVALKRTMDLAVSWLVLVLFSPLMLFLALLIKLTSRDGPVFYLQERVGLDGRPFQLVKFRSMRIDAEDESGPVWASADDERRTALGQLMRRWSLDELPQLVNVLVGEMSLVGPRPERPYFVEQFSRMIPRYAERHNEKAGMTGWAQVNGLRGQTSIEERTKYDVFYVENWSLALDVKILLKTVIAVVRDRNAY